MRWELCSPDDCNINSQSRISETTHDERDSLQGMRRTTTTLLTIFPTAHPNQSWAKESAISAVQATLIFTSIVDPNATQVQVQQDMLIYLIASLISVLPLSLSMRGRYKMSLCQLKFTTDKFKIAGVTRAYTKEGIKYKNYLLTTAGQKCAELEDQIV